MRFNHPRAGADNSPTAAQAADNPPPASASNTNEGVVNPATNNSGGYDRPVRTRAPPIWYGDACCHQALGLRHSEMESKKGYATVCANKRKTKETIAMVSLNEGQPMKMQDGQGTMMPKATRIIPYLVSTLHTSILHLSDICTNHLNMRHLMEKYSSSSNTLSKLGESSLLNTKLAMLSAPDTAQHCQPTNNTTGVAHKNLQNFK